MDSKKELKYKKEKKYIEERIDEGIELGTCEFCNHGIGCLCLGCKYDYDCLCEYTINLCSSKGIYDIKFFNGDKAWIKKTIDYCNGNEDYKNRFKEENICDFCRSNQSDNCSCRGCKSKFISECLCEYTKQL